MNVGVVMLVLVVCWMMFSHYRRRTRCNYCGAEWGKHLVSCPYGGSGTRMDS